MTTDLILAILHHFLILGIAGIIAAELVLVRSDLKGEAITRLARVDGMYGLFAMLVILVGAGRVFFGLKSWDYYIYYWVFWAKMAAFVTVGALSSRPTRAFMRWRKAAAGDPDYTVPHAEIVAARGFIRAEAAIFLLIPTFAAMMARGIGY